MKDWISNSVDPDETAHYEPSHLDLRCLQKTIIIVYSSEGVKRVFLISSRRCILCILIRITSSLWLSFESPRWGDSYCYRLVDANLISTFNISLFEGKSKTLPSLYKVRVQWNLDNSKSKGPNCSVWIIETLNNWGLKCIHIFESGLQNDFELLRFLNYWSLNYRGSTVYAFAAWPGAMIKPQWLELLISNTCP